MYTFDNTCASLARYLTLIQWFDQIYSSNYINVLVVSDINLGRFFAIITQNVSSPSCLSSASDIPVMCIQIFLELSQTSQKFCSVIFYPFFSGLVCKFSIDQSSSLFFLVHMQAPVDPSGGTIHFCCSAFNFQHFVLILSQSIHLLVCIVSLFQHALDFP